MSLRWTPLRLAAAVLALAFALAGCGYQSLLAASPSRAVAGADDPDIPRARVSVISLRNDSREPWLDRIVNDALRRELGLRGGLEFVADPERADYVVRGRILPLDQTGSSFSSLVVAVEYRVTLSLDVELVRMRGDILRLAPGPLSESEIYLASANLEITRTNRLEALRHLSDMLATRVADSVGFLQADRAAAPGDGAADGDDSEDGARQGARLDTSKRERSS